MEDAIWLFTQHFYVSVVHKPEDRPGRLCIRARIAGFYNISLLHSQVGYRTPAEMVALHGSGLRPDLTTAFHKLSVSPQIPLFLNSSCLEQL